MSQQTGASIHEKNGVYFKDIDCTSRLADQETAAILWNLKHTLEKSSPYQAPQPKTRGAKILLVLLILGALGIMAVSLIQWWPDLIFRFARPPVPAASGMTAAQGQLALVDELKNYTDRISDLEKLISALLGLSAIYTLALGLSSWASVQTNLQQAEKWIQGQQIIMREMKDQAEKSVEKLETLILRHEGGLAEMQSAINYAKKIPFASSSLALAVQGKYLSDAVLTIEGLKELRATHGTDRTVNIYLVRLYRVLGRYQNAVEAMTSYIQRKEAAGNADDTEALDAYYNRACYNCLLWPNASSAERDLLSEAIKKDVKRCISVNEDLRADIRGDHDFDSVRAEPWFKPFL